MNLPETVHVEIEEFKILLQSVIEQKSRHDARIQPTLWCRQKLVRSPQCLSQKLRILLYIRITNSLVDFLHSAII